MVNLKDDNKPTRFVI